MHHNLSKEYITYFNLTLNNLLKEYLNEYFYTILNLNRIYKKFILIFIDSLVLAFSFITYCIFSDYTLTNNFQNFNIEVTNLNLDLKFIILCIILYLI